MGVQRFNINLPITVETNKISECTVVSMETLFHLKINYKGGDYFFIVEIVLITKLSKILIKSIRRGNCHWDNGMKLKNSEKKEIKKMIEEYLN